MKKVFLGITLAMLIAVSQAFPIPDATLVFRDPVGVVGPTDSIPVWMTLALEDGGGSLQTDSSGNVIGLDLLTIQSHNPNYNLDSWSSYINVAFGCSGTFTAGCTNGPPYDFDFAFNGPGNPQAMTWPADLNVPDGSEIDYLFGTFSPTAVSVPSGTYQFFHSSVFIDVWDSTPEWLAANNNEASVARIYLAETPWSGGSTQEGTMFQRTVEGTSVVPEPTSLILLGSGLGVIGLAAWRRKK